MVRRSWAGGGPEELAVRFIDGEIVDPGFAASHQAAFVEFPQFVALAAMPAASIVAPLKLVAYGDPVVSESPQVLHELIIEFPIPLASEERPNLVAAAHELASVAPHRIFGVGQGDSDRVAGVSAVLGQPDLSHR